MRKLSITLSLLAAILLFQFCSSSKKVAAAKAVSYDASIKPIVQATCAPCHIAGKGNKKALDNFADASSVADDIIVRIQKNPEEKGFMPFKHPKLSEADIATFVAWKATGLKP